MKYETFLKKYKPIKNRIAKSVQVDGYMFETYGKERDRVLKAKRNNIWTLIDGEGRDLWLTNGWHICNRLGYFITKKAWKEGEDIEIKM